MRYMKNEHEAEEVLQISFIKVFRKLDKFKYNGTLGGWIRVLTTNTCIEQYRKHRSDSIKQLEIVSSSGENVNDEILQTINLEDLMSKIRRLSDGYRVVFNLYAIEGFNHREISELLGIAEGTSKSQYARAKKLLQKQSRFVTNGRQKRPPQTSTARKYSLC